MRSRGEDLRGRVEALLRDVKMKKMRNPRIEAANRARNTLLFPFVLSSNYALGARAVAFLKACSRVCQKGGGAWDAQFSSAAGVYLAYHLVLDFLVAADLHCSCGDESPLRRQGP